MPPIHFEIDVSALAPLERCEIMFSCFIDRITIMHNSAGNHLIPLDEMNIAIFCTEKTVKYSITVM